MRHVLAALAVAFATTGASAQTAAFFLGRPPSTGVVHGGGFGVGGFDYYGDGGREVSLERRRAHAAPGPGRPGLAHAPGRSAHRKPAPARSGRP